MMSLFKFPDMKWSPTAKVFSFKDQYGRKDFKHDDNHNEVFESSKLVSTFKRKDKIGTGEVNADVNGTSGLISIL